MKLLNTIIYSGALAGLVFQAQAQTAIPATAALPSSAADTNKPGFLWRVQQVASSQPTTLARTENQLAGLLGDNVADPSVTGPAAGPANPPSPSTAPIEFVIPTVINISQSEGTSLGNFTPDEQMPGIPGLTSSTDNIAAEILTWLDLPAGEITMGVNSDDGFRATLGGANPTDRFGVNVGEFDAGRGAADSIFRVTISKAGLYAARVIWNEGGGDANIEWFTVKSDGTKVLINDAANGGIKAYRGVAAGAVTAVLSKVQPLQNQTGVAPNASVGVEITEGSTPLNLADIKLSLDGAALAAAASKTGNVIRVSYTPPALFLPGTVHEAALVYAEGSVTKTNAWKFTVASYGTITPASKVTPDTASPGFLWNIFANAANQDNTIDRAERSLSGLLKDIDGSTLPNNADPNAKGIALAAAAAANPANGPLRFVIPGVINLTQAAADDADNKNGNFTPDAQMPGIPAIDGTDGIAAEAITYIELPAGVITMGVNSDDGFRTTSGNPLDVFESVLLGQFDGGRGAADTIFSFVVQEAGVYPFRTVWEEGNGGANIEWFSVKADGSKVLINDTANGGFKAYRAIQGATRPYVRYVSPGLIDRQLNQPSSQLVLVLSDGTTPIDDSSITLTLDGKAAAITKTRQGRQIIITHVPTTLQMPAEKISATLSYKDTGGQAQTRTWGFRNLRNLVLPAPFLVENFDSYEEGAVPTGWVEQNFTTTRTAGLDLDNLNSDSYKGWVVVSRARLEPLKSRIFNVPTGLFVNGQELTSLSDGNLLYAESDVRGGDQVQFITTKPYDLTKLTNAIISFSSLYEQNQDSVGAVEYSIDGGKNWLPVVYYLDQVDGGGDIKFLPDGTVDAVTTLTAPNLDTAAWVDNGVQKGDKYGDALLAPITPALGVYIAPRINDNPTIDKRVEVFRLPGAGGKSDVRLRFAQLGTGSWYFGIDNLSFYEGPAPALQPAAPVFSTTLLQSGGVKISWTGTGTLESADKVTGPWAAAASQGNPQTVTATGKAKFYRLRQ